MRIASWNVNSVRARLPRIEEWLDSWHPDILCLQETKVVDEEFPREPFASRGYNIEVFGQKTYNGVAIASLEPPVELFRGLPGDSPETSKRVIGGRFGELNLINVYAPNGTELGSERFAYKLEWFRQLRSLLNEKHEPGDPLLIIGDINIAPDDRDVYDPEYWRGRMLFTDEEHEAFENLSAWGLSDAMRELYSEAGIYSWWDYRAGMFHKGLGLRIDLALISEALKERLDEVTIDREARKGVKPSDHAPLIVDLKPTPPDCCDPRRD